MIKKEVLELIAMFFGVLFFPFIIMGIIYLVSWRHDPKWKDRFWWVTFAVTSAYQLLVFLVLENRPDSLICSLAFGIMAGLIWGIGRGWRSQNQEPKKKPEIVKGGEKMGFVKYLMNRIKFARPIDMLNKMVASYHWNRQHMEYDHDTALWYSHAPYFNKIIWDVWYWDQVCQTMGLSDSEVENFLKKKMTQFRAFLEHTGAYNDVSMAATAIMGIGVWRKSTNSYLTGDPLYNELMKGFSSEKYKEVERKVNERYERLKHLSSLDE